MELKLDDDLVGHLLTEEDLSRGGKGQPRSFEWQCFELVREIYAAGVRSFLRVVGVSDKLLKELLSTRNAFAKDSLLGVVATHQGSVAGEKFEGVFLLGIALGTQICTDQSDLAESIESSGSRTSPGRGTVAQIIDGEINSRLHLDAVVGVEVPDRRADGDFEGFAYDDSRDQLASQLGNGFHERISTVVAVPPGFSATGLLNISRAVMTAGEPGFGFSEDGSGPVRARDTVIGREWLTAGIWLGLWLRARDGEFGVGVDLARAERDDVEPGDRMEPSSGTLSVLVSGWEQGQGKTEVLARSRREREAVELPKAPGSKGGKGRKLVEHFIARLRIQLSIYSSQATGDAAWWPVHSFNEKGDLVLVRLAPFPRLSREELAEWFPDLSLAKLIPEEVTRVIFGEGASALGEKISEEPDAGQPAGADRMAERMWEEVPYVKWLIPESRQEGVANIGLDGLGVITSDPIWREGRWQATVGMLRPFVRSVTYGDVSAGGGSSLPLFAVGQGDEDSIKPSALTMLGNLQFLPGRTHVDARELASILKAAARSGGQGGRARSSRQDHDTISSEYGLYEDSHALTTDFERLKLAGANLRRGRRIEDLADICPWPVGGTWPEESAREKLPGRLKLRSRPEVSAYRYWCLGREQAGGLAWREEEEGHDARLLSVDGQDRKAGQSGAEAHAILDSLAGLLREDGAHFRPLAILVAIPEGHGSRPFEEALASLSRGEGRVVGGEEDIYLAAPDFSLPQPPEPIFGHTWQIDPEGFRVRSGLALKLESSRGRPPGPPSKDATTLFVIRTEASSSVIDIESVSAQIVRMLSEDPDDGENR